MPLGYGTWYDHKKSNVTKESTEKHGYKKPKGRTDKTYQNKINHLKRKYRKMFNSSKKRKTGFYLNYPTVEDYLKEFKLKQPNK